MSRQGFIQALRALAVIIVAAAQVFTIFAA
jgi:hypothetical protein